MDSIEYARRVGNKVEAWMRAGSTSSWQEMIDKAGNEVMAEEAEKEKKNGTR